MSLFNSRVNLSLDAYIKKTADMLVKASIPITSGFEDTTETFTNAGKMRNKGVEMTLRTINLKGLFSWESALTATYNKNEILDLNSETPMFINQMGNFCIISSASLPSDASPDRKSTRLNSSH